jgi:diadenosine tetraphosphate (Ap4A) HIT family hydrolase
LSGESGSVSFELHPRLAADCHRLGALPSGLLLLHRNAALHWFLLVPATGALDLLDLAAAEREALLDDAATLHRFLRERLAYPRVNVGALGLVVPQLHLHVVGRREDDPCWPAPVWGCLKEGPAWPEEALEALRAELRERLPLDASPGS